MRNFIGLIVLFFSCFASYGTETINTFLVSKEEYKILESSGTLMKEAFKHAFGASEGANEYLISMRKVDVWNEEMTEFRYFPDVDAVKKAQFSKSILASDKNSSINLRVSVNIEKSILKANIRECLDENNSFVLKIVVVGDNRIFVTEAKDKDVFNEMISQQTFIDKTFTKYFGENVMNLNYHIEVVKTKVCFIKNAAKSTCIQEFELSKSDSSYRHFSDKITSEEFSAQFVLFDVLVSKENSRLTQKANDAIIKEADRSEHIKFYFCIPKDNLRARDGKLIDMEGKIKSSEKANVSGVIVQLKDAANNTIASQTTDKNGYFKFDKVDEGKATSLFVDKSCKEKGLKLATKLDKYLGDFKKIKLGFEYKLLVPDLRKMEAVEAPDPAAEFITKIKARMVVVTDKVNPLKEQTIELKDASNKILQTKRTDVNGDFEFNGVNLREVYSIELPDYKEATKNEKVYLATTKNELVARVNKNADGKFAYKTIPADIFYLSSMEEKDVELTFSKQRKINENDIVIRDFVYYEVNSSELSLDAKATLDKIIKIASQNAAYQIEIISHTDCRGESAENLKLSQKRSEMVLDYFIKNNIDQKRLKPVGMGESKPLNTCIDGVSCAEEEFKMNRRTEFKFNK
jgi:outer membrane protein OmpA-like peptidoglycan-associated protein